jgi:uncharacterized protein involved in type VI secretion and phage assembly
MNLIDVLNRDRIEESLTSRVYGVVTAVVVSIDDPEELGRVKVAFPWLMENQESPWARVMAFMAGNDRGAVFRPEVDDEVLVLFDHGDMRFPYVIGALWNGQDPAPSEAGSNADNHIRLIKSRSGHIIKLDDTPDSEKIEIIDKTGNNTIVIDSASNTVTIGTDADIQVQAPNGKLLLEGSEVEIKSSGAVKIEAGSTMDVEASGTMNISGATVNIN